jgi:type IV secretion system protein VirB11
VTELCINRPGEAFVESAGGWQRLPLAFASFEWCLRLCKLVANATQQRIDEQSPLLSASLPEGERIQLVMPPATPAQTVSITIRKPAPRTWALDEMAQRGIFERTHHTGTKVDPLQEQLLCLLQRRDYVGFMRMAVTSKQNILVSGPTGSGKTTWTKALIREIPANERLISIEDAQELVLDRHPNHVRLFYSKGGQGRSRVTPKQLLEACLRMKPDRILLAELRADEAFDYLRNVNSGHPGSITSIHAAGKAE